MRGPYQFKREDAEDFARFIGAKFNIRGEELFFVTCPYCQGGGKDKYTFSINLRTGLHKCFRSGCNVHGNMITLAKDFDFSLGQNADEYYKPKRHYKIFKQPAEPIQPKDLSLAYLESRGIPAEIAARYEITDKDGVIVFPFRDEKNQIQTIKYRNPNPAEGQSKEWFERNCKPILFGMAQCNTANKTLIVTEGQMDSLSVAAAGLENAVSVPGGVNSFTWVPYCWDWIANFERIIVFGDNEHGKITLHADFFSRWKNRVWCVRSEDYRECKDANDILRKYGPEQIRHCIENAAQPPISNVISMADVEDVDINAMEKLPTGLPSLDETLLGGLPFGQVILITGKSGDGKSTLADQLIINAIDDGYPTFIYSGELPNYLLKKWMTFQAAGPTNMERIRSYGTNGMYDVLPEAKAKINRWLGSDVWIYDNTIASVEEPEEVKLLELLEIVIEQKGVRVVLLDNLMTAMDLEPDGRGADKYEKQSEFSKKLARLAMKHKVLVILVAHKRKMGAQETNDTVSGSADIVNLASIVLSYERGKKEDGDDIRWLKVTKNRLFGAVNDGIKLTFEPRSKRIYQPMQDVCWKYGWEFDELPEDNEEQTALPWEV